MKHLTDAEYYALDPPIKRFWHRVKQLKMDFPSTSNVKIRTWPHKTLYKNGYRIYGCCKYSDKGDTYTIHIERHKDVSVMVDTLMHEYAHIFTWDTFRDHPRKFWHVYGKIYRRYQDGEKT